MSISVDLITKPLKVLRRIQETPDAVSLVLQVPPELKSQFHYQAGQFVTFFMTLQGEVISRSYSLSSSPLCDSDFKITVKKVSGGRGSTYLCEQVKEGDVLHTTPPTGRFFKPSLEPKGVHYFLFAAGSGVTPVYSILKTVLNSSNLNRVTFVFCNRNEESVIFRQELEDWAKKFPGRLDVLHVLSKPSDAWPGRAGRLNRTTINEVLEMPTQGPSAREYYVCGPTEFMHVVRNSLIESGVRADLIHEENFADGLHKPAAQLPTDWTYIGPNPEKASEGCGKILALINGEQVEVAAKEGKSILETLLESGAQPPYSCMDGACMACLAKVQQGRVYQEDPGILTDDNIANCEALTCQAKPLSSIVKISYDDL